MIILFAFVILALIWIVISALTNIPIQFGLSFIVATFGSFILQGLRKIPAEPPHIAVVTIFGERTRQIKKEGWRFFPLAGFWYDCIVINMTKKNQDLPPQVVRTRDLAELEITVSLTWTPNEDYAIEYLNNGGESGVKNILADMVRERLREWAISVDKGPKNWEDALRAQDEATAMLIRDIAGVLPRLSKEEEKEIIRKIRLGDGVQPIPQLGITLNRLNIGEIKPKGELARAAELLVKEEKEREGEKIELYHAMDRVKEIMESLGCSYTQAIELFQTERGKVSKKITEIKGSVSDDVRKAVEQIIESWQRRR